MFDVFSNSKVVGKAADSGSNRSSAVSAYQEAYNPEINLELSLAPPMNPPPPQNQNVMPPPQQVLGFQRGAAPGGFMRFYGL